MHLYHDLALAIFEAWALLNGRKPITSYVRDSIHAMPGWAFAVALAIGTLFGHFFWK